MPSVLLELSISENSPVLVRDQLIEQIGLQIACGKLKFNDKLSSIRALAKKLSIHHSIVHAAYTELAEIGMLEIRQGSGVRVASAINLNGDTSSSLNSFLMQFFSKAVAAGFSRQEIVDCFNKVIERAAAKRILVIDSNPDFHSVILSELKPHFDLPIVAMTATDVDKDHSILSDSFVITSLYNLFAIQALPLDQTRFLICNVEPAQEVANIIRSLPKSSIILFVSTSQTLLRKAEKFAAGLRGDSIIVRTVLTTDTKEISYMMNHAKAIICDRASHKTMSEMAKKIPLYIFELYSNKTIANIKKSLTEWG